MVNIASIQIDHYLVLAGGGGGGFAVSGVEESLERMAMPGDRAQNRSG